MTKVTKALMAFAVGSSLLMAAPGFAKGLTVTTNNGGEVSKQHTCIQGDQVVSCETVNSATNGAGETVSKSTVRTNNGGSTDVTVRTTGPDGATNTRDRGLVVTR